MKTIPERTSTANRRGGTRAYLAHLLPSRLYCRFWNRTKSCRCRLADYTADREFHPALKIAVQLSAYNLLPPGPLVKRGGGGKEEFCDLPQIPAKKGGTIAAKPQRPGPLPGDEKSGPFHRKAPLRGEKADRLPPKGQRKRRKDRRDTPVVQEDRKRERKEAAASHQKKGPLVPKNTFIVGKSREKVKAKGEKRRRKTGRNSLEKL